MIWIIDTAYIFELSIRIINNYEQISYKNYFKNQK